MRLAREAGAIIVSADSMQVYRGMDIGTAKPSLAERAEVPHYLIDLVDPEDPFSVADYQREGRQVVTENSGRRILVVGGSGLHVRALVDPLEFSTPKKHDGGWKLPIRGLVRSWIWPILAGSNGRLRFSRSLD